MSKNRARKLTDLRREEIASVRALVPVHTTTKLHQLYVQNEIPIFTKYRPIKLFIQFSFITY